jgi:hypothetical protein
MGVYDSSVTVGLAAIGGRIAISSLKPELLALPSR